MSRLRMARPLPECGMCDMPTARAVYLRNGGVCTRCDEEIHGVATTVRMARVPPGPGEFVSDATVMVEGYVPPVPGQLTIEETE